MCCKQPPDAEMRCSASFLRDEEIGSFLDTVVDKPVGTLQPLDHLVTDRLPEMRVDLLLRCPVHESKRRDRCAVSQARDRKSTRLNSSHRCISYAVFCLK